MQQLLYPAIWRALSQVGSLLKEYQPWTKTCWKMLKSFQRPYPFVPLRQSNTWERPKPAADRGMPGLAERQGAVCKALNTAWHITKNRASRVAQQSSKDVSRMHNTKWWSSCFTTVWNDHEVIICWTIKNLIGFNISRGKCWHSFWWHKFTMSPWYSAKRFNHLPHW